MKVTADTITDDQIRELLAISRNWNDGTAAACLTALSRAIPPAFDTRAKARARCAAAWNARHGHGR